MSLSPFLNGISPFSRPHFVPGGGDPLAGISWVLRLQTKSGFGANPNAIIGLYQDVSCTIPVVSAGDLVAARRDELGTSGVIASQSNSGKRGILNFDGSTPYVECDGSNDSYLPDSNFRFNEHTIYVLVRLSVDQVSRVIISEFNPTGSDCYFAVGISDSVNNRVKYFSSSSGTSNTLEPAGADLVAGQWYVLTFAQDAMPTKYYWQDGVLIGSQAGTNTSATDTVSSIDYIEAFGGIQFFEGDDIAILVANSFHDSTTRGIVESYLLDDLKP